MTIHQLVSMAKRIHDTEGWNLGSASTRETRNRFLARVIGSAYHGHPEYNPTPDRQWHLKRADAGRPQTDDVATSMPSRNHWDCIPGSGADGYRFEATAHGVLPAEQIVYPPPMPNGDDVDEPPPPPTPSFPYPDEATAVLAFQNRVKKAYNAVGRLFPDPNDSDAYRHFCRFGYSCSKMPEPDAANKHITELRAQLGAPPE